MQIVLKNATLFSPNTTFHFQTFDILIHDGIIVDIASDIDVNCDLLIEKEDLHVSAGWFDPSVAFGEPGHEERETLENGIRTAALSGFTGVGLLPTSSPVPDHRSAIAHLSKSGDNSPTQLHPIASFTQKGGGIKMAELFDLHQFGAIGFLDDQTPISNTELLKTALLYAQRFEGVIYSIPKHASLAAQGMVHEGVMSTQLGLNGLPRISETLQIQRDLSLLSYTKGRLHIPCISAGESVDMIREAKRKGLQVTCSVSLANLYFTDQVLRTFDTRYKVFPPLREEKDKEALKQGLLDGTIDFITCDHRPLNPELKQVEFDHAAYGSIGLEVFFGILNTLLPLDKTLQLLINNRKISQEQIPEIAIGKKANLTLFTPNGTSTVQEKDILSSSKNCAYLNCTTQGKVYGVIRDKHHQLHH